MAIGLVSLALIAGGVLWYQNTHHQVAAAEDRAALAQRFKEWAYIAKTKQISPSEEVTMIVVPSALTELLDVKCIVYKNREYKQVVMTCPDATQSQIDLSSEP